MLFAIISYFVSFFLVGKIKKKQRIKYKEFPLLYLRRGGIVFFSEARHRLNIENVKTMQVGKNVYLKKNNKVIILSNVDNIQTHENYLYFTCLGKTKVEYNCIDFYRYFNIIIKSNQIDLNSLKQQAINELLNNLFDVNASTTFLRYLKIVKKVLNINITKDKIQVRQNKLKIPFVLVYKINNIKKRIYINETL